MDVALEETICDSVKYTLTSWNQHWYSTHKIDRYEINMFLRIYVRPPPQKKKPTKFTKIPSVHWDSKYFTEIKSTCGLSSLWQLGIEFSES